MRRVGHGGWGVLGRSGLGSRCECGRAGAIRIRKSVLQATVNGGLDDGRDTWQLYEQEGRKMSVSVVREAPEVR